MGVVVCTVRSGDVHCGSGGVHCEEWWCAL